MSFVSLTPGDMFHIPMFNNYNWCSVICIIVKLGLDWVKCPYHFANNLTTSVLK